MWCFVLAHYLICACLGLWCDRIAAAAATTAATTTTSTIPNSGAASRPLTINASKEMADIDSRLSALQNFLKAAKQGAKAAQLDRYEDME